MNKYLKGTIVTAMSGIMLFAVACTPESNNPPEPGKKTHNTETRILQLSTSALDGNFNPFFYTSGNDGNMLALTQIGLLTMDEKGNIVCGENEACAALDRKTTYLSENGEVIQSGVKEGFTEYEFIIKDGIKFSDGTPLTIKDVLFSLYVYLDSAYTGSATIYSTDIVGLTAYRTQSETASSDDAIESGFTATAMERINNIISWADDSPTTEKVPSNAQVAADYATVQKLFKEEAESDWTSVETSFPESYNKSYRFTEVWQAYLFNEGVITTQKRKNNNGVDVEIYDDTNGNNKKDDGELYYTTLDNPYGTTNDPEAQAIILEIAEETTDAKVNSYMSQHNCTKEYAIKELQKAYCVNKVYQSYASDKGSFKSDSFTNPLIYWATATNALQAFAGDERTKYFDDIKAQHGGKLAVQSITGITTSTTNKDYSGKDLGKTHDVLKIKINGIDPKAEQNFAFTVAPLHYYSGTYTDEKGKTTNYVTEANCKDNFGVATGDSTFFNEVLKDTQKNGLPVGAGPYKASNINGTADSSKDKFYANGVVYFMRNDNFQTVGAGIKNAKIKYINYKELTDDRIMEALTTQSIDFGMPNATATNRNLASQNKEFLGQQNYKTGGYGYVGVNPKFIREYPVRQAIMKAMDTSMTAAYYEGLAEPIYRPMSTTSWAYPEKVTEYPAIAYTTVNKEITDLVESAGYVKENGIYTKRRAVDGMANAPIGTKLEFPFTIAGATTDHPATKMFTEAAERLNGLGFKIIVSSGASALKDMISGNLEVWAAAWSSALDPDPYQVYHKDSKATSVNNWNYPQIKQDKVTWGYEWDIIERLSTKIDEGRETTVKENRIQIYEECLNLIMDLAVELPTYQRDDLCVYNTTVIDVNSLVQSPSYIMGLFDKIWEIDYV